jgi:hypothetical protein
MMKTLYPQKPFSLPTPSSAFISIMSQNGSVYLYAVRQQYYQRQQSHQRNDPQRTASYSGLLSSKSLAPKSPAAESSRPATAPRVLQASGSSNRIGVTHVHRQRPSLSPSPSSPSSPSSSSGSHSSAGTEDDIRRLSGDGESESELDPARPHPQFDVPENDDGDDEPGDGNGGEEAEAAEGDEGGKKEKKKKKGVKQKLDKEKYGVYAHLLFRKRDKDYKGKNPLRKYRYVEFLGYSFPLILGSLLPSLMRCRYAVGYYGGTEPTNWDANFGGTGYGRVRVKEGYKPPQGRGGTMCVVM